MIQNQYRWAHSYDKYGGAVYNAGIFDMYGGTIQLCYANYGSGVYNTGRFRLYDGIITDNGQAYIGSGVYNSESGLFEMYGASITENDAGSYAGGVGNAGIFRLFDGSIDNNYANSNGGVFNSYEGIIHMTGGVISNNRSDYSSAGIYNASRFYMSGGSISGNTCTDKGGAFTNYNFLEITGGTIENNVAGRGGAIYGSAESTTIISGGLIQNNTAAYGGAIYNEGAFAVSANAQIPAGTDDKNNIHLFNPLTIEGDITYTGSYALVLENYSNAVGSKWIDGATAKLVSDNISKFYLINNKYSFDNNGYVVSQVEPKTYYVGGEDASDSNDGSQANPFATLDHAFIIGNDAISTFVLQSDQVLTRTVTIKGDITIKSDGNSRKVSKSAGFLDDYMFRVESGSLTFGDKNNADFSDLLIFDGLNVKKNYGLLYNESVVNIYNGVTISNFDTGYYFFMNIGTLNMYGGSIERNAIEEYGIIFNAIDFNMYGGTIRNNNGTGVYNSDSLYFEDEFPDTVPTFKMSAGSIYGNIAEKGAAVYHKEGSVVLSGSLAFSRDGDLHNDIFMEYGTSKVTIGGELTSSDQITLGIKYYYDGQQILDGGAYLIRNNYHRFTLTNPGFIIDEQGIARYNKPSVVYYVNALGDDVATGGINDPFATIQKAIDEIGIGMGTIILQSDITINKSVIVTGSVNIQSDGEVRTILKGDTFVWDEDLDRNMVDCMFYVSGELRLGDMDGNDLNPSLYLNGNGETRGAHIYAIINNAGKLDIYPGVVLHNNISDRRSAGVISTGDIHMYGGSIRDNVSEDFSGVLVRSGTFIMGGGSISNNIGSDSGVIVDGGSFIMNGGNITENISSGSEGPGIAGVYGISSRITINGGNISRNNGGIGGISVDRSIVDISGGNVEDNIGMIAGIYVLRNSNISVSGGNIRNNNASIAGGVLIGLDSLLHFSGGTIGGNIGALSQGIFVEESSQLALSGSALVEADNRIIIQEWNTENALIINGPLQSNVTALIDVYRMDMEAEDMEYTQEFILGRKILVSPGEYKYTWDDVSRLVLADNDYAININGNIGRAIKDSGVSPIGSEVYSGREKKVNVVVRDGDTVLTKGVHYSVSYLDNIGVGQATVLIAGMGDYGGVIRRPFNIYKAPATRILTPIPSEKRFSAAENMTEAELLESITLSRVEVDCLNTTAWLPVEWKLTQGKYNPLGGTYIYTGTIIGDSNIDSNGLTLTMKIMVEPFESYFSEMLSIGTDNEMNSSVIYRKNGDNLYVEYLISEKAFRGDDKVIIPISTDEIIRELKSDDMESIHISLTIPSTILDAGALIHTVYCWRRSL